MVKLKYPPPKEFLETEMRNGYTISADMKKVWAVELDLAQELLRVCEKHKLNIYAISGTLLGAMRHEGFIPWDDDMDFVMPRKDYKLLCDVAPQEFKSPYFLQESNSGKELVFGCAKLRNSATTALEINRVFSYNQGISIDIFPLDNLSDAQSKKFFQKKRGSLYRTLTWGFAFFSTRYFPAEGISRIPKKVIHKLFSPLFVKLQSFFYKKMTRISQIYNRNKTKQSQVFVFTNMYDDFYNEDFDLVRWEPFEYIKVPIMNGFDRVLRATYGERWRQPAKEPNCHGTMLFDTDKSYLEYLKESVEIK